MNRTSPSGMARDIPGSLLSLWRFHRLRQGLHTLRKLLTNDIFTTTAEIRARSSSLAIFYRQYADTGLTRTETLIHNLCDAATNESRQSDNTKLSLETN